jgi:hypothetical protein
MTTCIQRNVYGIPDDNNKELLMDLIDSGYEITEEDLEESIFTGDLEIITFMHLNSGLEGNCMEIACEIGNFRVIEHLVKLGMEVSLLHILKAVECRHYEVVGFLVGNCYTRPTTKDAILCKSEYLLKYLTDNNEPLDGTLLLAIKENSLKLTYFLLLSGAKVTDDCLTFAIKLRRFKIFKLLSDFDCKITVRHLRLAMNCDSREIAEFLSFRV